MSGDKQKQQDGTTATPTKDPLYQDALEYHTRGGVPGKISVTPTKPLTTQRQLALAYSPGVAAPCEEIARDPSLSYEYTARGNMVAVITNGTAVLGLGNLGAAASKPVMEGKAVLFKRFADIDSVDIEVDTRNVDEFVNCVRLLGQSWGGINLEDIAGPECFVIERRLKEAMDIPVFHDDQHGTAIICAAGLINAAHVTGRRFEDLVVVVSGAGAAGIACIELIKRMGVKDKNVYLCDRTGVVYEGRNDDSMNEWKARHAVTTDKRTLADALVGADVFLGLSVAGALSPAMLKGMNPKPIIFAMANPVPEIKPELAKQARPDCIIATGRSDYPNQVNNVMGFPYIFRGALDVRAKNINEEMKIAAAKALAELARRPVPDEVAAAYAGKKMEYGPEYIIPVPFDPRLIYTIPPAVAKAAQDTGVAGKPIADMQQYINKLKTRLNPTANAMNLLFDRLKASPRTVIFSEGEDEKVIRAAAHWRDNGYGTPKLVGRTKHIHEAMARLGVVPEGIEICNAALAGKRNEDYIDLLYERLQRRGYLRRDCVRMVKTDRNIFSACMLQLGDGDAVVTGTTRDYYDSLEDVLKAVSPAPGAVLFGMTVMIAGGKTVFIADTTINEMPTSEELAQIAIHTAREARRLGQEPRVAMLSFSNFGSLPLERAQEIRNAVEILDETPGIDFEYDGEMSADVALNKEMMALYPFCRLSDPANVLVMPSLHPANIASRLLQELGGGTTIGPVLIGLEKPVQIVHTGASVSDILNLAALAAIQSFALEAKKKESKRHGHKAA
jgi:malate dehydrogenase (oxaloacetate-decarboxylating)(NADP+)